MTLLSSIIRLAPLVVLGVSSPALAGELEPFPGVTYSRIKAVYFNGKAGRPECMMPLNEDGSLCSSVQGPGKWLSKKQVARLTTILNDPRSYKMPFASCFIPHHALLLYDAKNKPVAQVSICFMCERLALEPGKPSARSLSTKGQAALQKLCRDLGLKACDE